MRKCPEDEGEEWVVSSRNVLRLQDVGRPEAQKIKYKLGKQGFINVSKRVWIGSSCWDDAVEDLQV